MAITTPPKMMDGVKELSDSPSPPCQSRHGVLSSRLLHALRNKFLNEACQHASLGTVPGFVYRATIIWERLLVHILQTP